MEKSKQKDYGDAMVDMEENLNIIIEKFYDRLDFHLFPPLMEESGLTHTQVYSIIHNIEFAKCDMAIELMNLVYKDNQ